MSGNGKRSLPPNTMATAALVPVSSNGTTAGRSTPSEDLIDQLVGGLTRTDGSPEVQSDDAGGTGDTSFHDRVYSIDDEEIDEPPVPIPSTWHDDGQKSEPSWWVEQLKASAYGFVVGLFVVIPAVMLLTGQAERLPSIADVGRYVNATTARLGLGDLFVRAPSDRRSPSTAPAPSTTTSAPVDTRTAADGSKSSVDTRTAADGSKSSVDTRTAADGSNSSVARGSASKPAQERWSSLEQPATPRTARLAAALPATTATSTPPTVPDTAPASAGPVAQITTLQPMPEPDASLPPSVTVLRPRRTAESTGPVSRTVSAPVHSQSQAAPAGTAPLARPETEIAAVTPAPAQAADGAATPAPAQANGGAIQSTAPSTDQQPAKTVAPETTTAEPTPTGTVANDAPARAAAAADSARQSPPKKPKNSLDLARKTIRGGDIEGARIMLAKLASRGNSEAIFALAETYDPNVLAAWGTHGQESNPERARMFYSMALAQGVERAKVRIKALE